MRMRFLLIILISLSYAFALDGMAEEFEIVIPKDPFSPDFPRYLKAPPDSVFDSWNYIIRINEHTHAKTPIVTEIRSRGSEIQVTVIRMIGDKVDLKYGLTLKHGDVEGRRTPDWVNSLDETDDAHGIDGTTTTIEIYTKGKTRVISRWSRKENESVRGLSEMNEWIDFYYGLTGIVARPYITYTKDSSNVPQ